MTTPTPIDRDTELREDLMDLFGNHPGSDDAEQLLNTQKTNYVMEIIELRSRQDQRALLERVNESVRAEDAEPEMGILELKERIYYQINVERAMLSADQPPGESK